MISQEFMEEAHIWWDITYAGKNGNLSWEEMNIAKRANAINAYSERILSDEEFLSVGDHPKNFWEWTDDEQRKWNLTELKKKWQKEATDFTDQAYANASTPYIQSQLINSARYNLFKVNTFIFIIPQKEALRCGATRGFLSYVLSE